MKKEHIEEIVRLFHVYDVPEHDQVRISADYGRIEASDTPLHALQAVYRHCEHHYQTSREVLHEVIK